jgi:hypothetical protein
MSTCPQCVLEEQVGAGRLGVLALHGARALIGGILALGYALRA